MPYAEIIKQVLNGIQAAIAAWPQVQGIITSAKAMITALFEGKVISIEDQAALHAYIDGIALMAKQGLIPPPFQVDPDPVTPSEPTPAPGDKATTS